MIPKYRTTLFAIWRACERFGILPPDIKSKWDENDVLAQAELIAYDQIRQIEHMELLSTCASLQPLLT